MWRKEQSSAGKESKKIAGVDDLKDCSRLARSRSVLGMELGGKRRLHPTGQSFHPISRA